MKESIVMYPGPGIGHIISMVELSKLLLHHYPNNSNFSITIFLTTGFLDHPSIDSYIQRISQSYPSVSFLRFPPVAVDRSTLRSLTAMCFDFFHRNIPHVASSLSQISRATNIHAFVIDFFCTPVIPIATSLNIPVFHFFTSGAAVLSAFLHFPLIHQQYISSHQNTFKDLSAHEIHFPGNPPLKSCHIVEPLLDRDDTAYWDFLDCMTHLPDSNGVVVNTFQELQPIAVKAIAEGKHREWPVFYIGPLIAEPTGKEKRSSETSREILAWLDEQPKRSVVYLCFGSRGLFTAAQLKEIAAALERSDVRFLWVVKKPPVEEATKQTEDTTEEFDLESVLPQGFIERTKHKGMVVKSWAPQVEVLSKESVGGFVSHCGWNSVLEAVVAGVPMIAWPLYAEQHMNRNEMVEDLKIALGLHHREGDEFVSGEELENKLRELMESEKGKEMRERSLKIRDMAASATAPNGSSTKALNELVERHWKINVHN